MEIQIVDPRVTPEMLTPAHEADAGIDLRACLNTSINIPLGLSYKVNSGIKVAMEPGWVGLLIPKSGDGSKGKHLANVIGVIDAGYRGPVLMNIKNNSNNIKPMIINPLDKLVQMVVIPHYEYKKMKFVDSLSDTARGEDGFGSTDDGIK